MICHWQHLIWSTCFSLSIILCISRQFNCKHSPVQLINHVLKHNLFPSLLYLWRSKSHFTSLILSTVTCLRRQGTCHYCCSSRVRHQFHTCVFSAVVLRENVNFIFKQYDLLFDSWNIQSSEVTLAISFFCFELTMSLLSLNRIRSMPQNLAPWEIISSNLE